MKTSTIIWIIVVIVIILGGILWLTTRNNQPAAPQTTVTQTASTTPVLTLGSNATIPSFLTAPNGAALYTYKSDTSGVSNCTGVCAAAWPPYTVSTSANLTGAPGITGTLSTITRADGTTQVTYNGMPLYFFAKDTGPGIVTGNGVGGFTIATPTATATSQTSTAPATTAPAPATTPAPASATPAPTAPAYNY